MENMRDELDQRIKHLDILLKRQELEEKQKKWWKRPTVLISLLTLGVGFLGGIETSSIQKDEVKKEIESLKVQKSILIEDVERKNIFLSDLKEETGKIELKKGELESQVSSLNESIAEKRGEVNSLLSDISKKKDIISGYEKDISDLNRKLKEVTRKYNEMLIKTEGTNKKSQPTQ